MGVRACAVVSIVRFDSRYTPALSRINMEYILLLARIRTLALAHFITRAHPQIYGHVDVVDWRPHSEPKKHAHPPISISFSSPSKVPIALLAFFCISTFRSNFSFLRLWFSGKQPSPIQRLRQCQRAAGGNSWRRGGGATQFAFNFPGVPPPTHAVPCIVPIRWIFYTIDGECDGCVRTCF